MRSAHQIVQDGLLGVYRVIFVRGLLRFSFGRRLFYALYDLYKLLFEAGPIKELRAFVPRGSSVIDVGANVGFFTTRFAAWTGPDGIVIAIEPEGSNFEELRRRCVAKGLLGIVTLHQAVADQEPGTSHLVINPEHPGDHKIGASGQPVVAVSIDSLRNKQTKPVDLIKIDVQGAEMRVLTGAERTITSDRPALFIEVDGGALIRFGTSGDALLGFLRRHGYRPHRLQKGGAVALDDAAFKALVARHGYVDILFLAERQETR